MQNKFFHCLNPEKDTLVTSTYSMQTFQVELGELFTKIKI